MKLPTPSEEAITRFLPGLDRWVNRGIAPGSFLCAVLANNLRDALACGDEHSVQHLKPLVTYIHCHLPAGCWGSEDRFRAWRGLIDRLGRGEVRIYDNVDFPWEAP